ncbi:hypothetical protein SEPCBS119000_001133 [Sporothrix epigloea]|uniref:Mpv17/PMP22 family protein n=1 Tax=Sporothrix epigloea TaxID=1892477 RepID=A0ABP0D8Z9_9PEZI
MTVGLLTRAFWRAQPTRLLPGRTLTQLTPCRPPPLQPFRVQLHSKYSHPPQRQTPRRSQTTAAEKTPPSPEQKQIGQPHISKAEALPETEAHKSLPSPGPISDDPIPVAGTVPPLPLWQRLGPLTWAADSYGRAQRRRPYVTQLLSALVIALCADMSVQRMNRGEPYDPKRTIRSLIIGGVSAIPIYKWFIFLAHHFNYASRALSLATKVTVNQMVFTPINNTYFFGMQALLAGETLATTWERVQQTVPVSALNSLKVWPAVTVFSFTFVPLEYRSIFAGVFNIGWQTYLMYLNRKVEDATHVEASNAAEDKITPAATVIAAKP